MRTKCAGTTLVEVLVTIGIIGILAGIVVPLLPYVRECSNVSTCVSNQKQLAAALLEYASDWDGVVPGGALLLDKSGKNIVTWDQAIKVYVTDNRIFHCPSDESKGTRSYALNDQRYRVNKCGYGDFCGTRLSILRDASKKVMLQDWYDSNNNLGSGMWVSVIGPRGHGGFHHNDEGSVITFYDGHASYFKAGTLKNDYYFFNPDP